jgi:hypothetical protein
MVRFVLAWLAGQFELKERMPYGIPLRQLGELYRADAKAEGERIVLGGWELDSAADSRKSRWFSIELGRRELPWAYSRGDPFRAIASLELLATLLCLVVFQPRAGSLARGAIGLTAAGDNQSNGFALANFGSTKYPLYLVLMELAEHLRKKSVVLSVAWRPRDENEEADALTNQVYEAFDPALRVPVVWKELGFFVLPSLTALAEGYFCELQALKRQSKVGLSQASTKKAKQALKVLDPW